MTDNPQELTTSQLEGQRRLTEIYVSSLWPYEWGVRMRKHFHMGLWGWTLIVPDAASGVVPEEPA